MPEPLHRKLYSNYSSSDFSPSRNPRATPLVGIVLFHRPHGTKSNTFIARPTIPLLARYPTRINTPNRTVYTIQASPSSPNTNTYETKKPARNPTANILGRSRTRPPLGAKPKSRKFRTRSELLFSIPSAYITALVMSKRWLQSSPLIVVFFTPSFHCALALFHAESLQYVIPDVNFPKAYKRHNWYTIPALTTPTITANQKL